MRLRGKRVVISTQEDIVEEFNGCTGTIIEVYDREKYPITVMFNVAQDGEIFTEKACFLPAELKFLNNRAVTI